MPSSESISHQQNNLKKTIYEIRRRRHTSKQIVYSQRQNAKTGRRRRRIRRRTIKSLFSKPEVRKDSSERKTTSSEMLAIHCADGRATEPQQL
jgi:FKBP-type peptidyl-prolyl cis-trans isomerase (trigger factor)